MRIIINRYVAVFLSGIFIIGCASKKTSLKLSELKSQSDSLLIIVKRLEQNESRIDSLHKDIQRIKLVTDYMGSKMIESARVNLENTRKKYGDLNDENETEVVHDIPQGTSFAIGPVNAKLTIVEFSDFQCPYCSEAFQTMDALIKKYPDDVRLIVKNFPLSFHPKAKMAAASAMAAGRQGKYFEYRKLLFSNNNKFDEDLFVQYAAKLGLDVMRFKRDMKLTEGVEDAIEKDVQLGKQLGVRGTPTYFVNGKLAKDRSLKYFENILEKVDG